MKILIGLTQHSVLYCYADGANQDLPHSSAMDFAHLLFAMQCADRAEVDSEPWGQNGAA
jgi:hypothetical protein